MTEVTGANGPECGGATPGRDAGSGGFDRHGLDLAAHFAPQPLDQPADHGLASVLAASNTDSTAGIVEIPNRLGATMEPGAKP